MTCQKPLRLIKSTARLPIYDLDKLEKPYFHSVVADALVVLGPQPVSQGMLQLCTSRKPRTKSY
eukprot:CAMPEP_0185281614 /NCGR_PEP_ID=MMETSP1359-20130426/66816_1 /TAXON_ID=552665 /ORGANISM="Bigelowiella longifila, Strain CCMP242" /LENGTH=63 /DNA_ID=CAMNT_0027877065 /DNA_START=34 /DNA_END=225 /DNA_ORIENTATION=+